MKWLNEFLMSYLLHKEEKHAQTKAKNGDYEAAAAHYNAIAEIWRNMGFVSDNIAKSQSVFETASRYDSISEFFRGKADLGITERLASFTPMPEKPSLTFDDIHGMRAQKRKVRDDILQSIETFRTLLVYGPDGVGKTMLAKVMAASLGREYIDATSMVYDVRNQTALLQSAPDRSVVHIRMFDRINPSETFLKEIDRINNEGETIVIATTSRPWDIPLNALPYFMRKLYIPLPDRDERKIMIKETLRELRQDSLIETIADRTDGLGYHELLMMCLEAARTMAKQMNPGTDFNRKGFEGIFLNSRDIEVEDFTFMSPNTPPEDMIKFYGFQQENGG